MGALLRSCAVVRACLRMFMLGVLIFFSASLASAQPTGASEEKLEQDFTDPLTTLPQLLIRDSYSPATYGTHVQTNQMIVRPIITHPAQCTAPFHPIGAADTRGRNCS